MRIRLIALGTKMPAWVTQGYQDYEKRLSRDVQLSLHEIPLIKRSKGSDVARIVEKEGDAMLALLGKGHRIVSLDVKGKMWGTLQLAEQLRSWLGDGRDVDLLIGGPEGLSSKCQQRVEQRWSLSSLTLPHPMVRVIVAEALFRAWSYNNNHPYHRE